MPALEGARASATSPRSVHDSRVQVACSTIGDEVDEPPGADEVVHEVAAGSHPHLCGDLELQVAQPLGRHQPAVGDAAGEARLLGPEQESADRRVDAVGADQRVELGAGAVGETGLDAIAAVDEAVEAVSGVDPLGGERVPQRGKQVGAMHLVVREAERCLERLRQRRAQQGAAVVPAALVPGQRPHPGARQLARPARARAAPARRSG